ncbi:MAG: TolC family protein [Candidatus Omnitrophica bacterium]|nr:TolC family protein [Candidatus Omnitrophota bacterium]
MKHNPYNLKVLCLFSSVFFLSIACSFADDNTSLEYFLKEALSNNPRIISAKFSYESATARIPQAASLTDPIIEVEYDKIFADRMLSGNPMKTLSVSQEISFPTKIYLKAKIASKIARMQYQIYKNTEQEVLSEVKKAYFELFFLERSIEINEENKALLKQIASTLISRYGNDLAQNTDVLRAQAETTKSDVEIIMLEQKKSAAQAKLNTLINRGPDITISNLKAENPISLDKTIDELFEEAKKNNTELKAYNYALEKGKAAYNLSLHEFLPDFSLKYKQSFSKNDFVDNSWAGMVGVTIPLWFATKQVFGVKEMKSELSMLKSDYKEKENEVLFELRNAFSLFESSKKLIELYDTSLIPQARQISETALKSYESDKTGLSSVIEIQKMFLDFKLERYKAILELRIAYADLEKITGIKLK